MTDNEPTTDRKLNAAGWTVLLFVLAASGSIIATVLYFIVQYANSLGGGQ